MDGYLKNLKYWFLKKPVFSVGFKMKILVESLLKDLLKEAATHFLFIWWITLFKHPYF